MALAEDIQAIVAQVFDNTLVPGLNLVEAVSVQNLDTTPTFDGGTPTYTNPSVISTTALFRKYNVEEVEVSGGVIQRGDAELKFQSDDLTNGLNIDDEITITDSSQKYIVINPDVRKLDGSELLVIAQCREIA